MIPLPCLPKRNYERFVDIEMHRALYRHAAQGNKFGCSRAVPLPSSYLAPFSAKNPHSKAAIRKRATRLIMGLPSCVGANGP